MTRSSPGFSLIEVLAALVVTGLIVIGVTPFIRQLLMNWSRGSEIARVVELKTRGLGRLREDARHIVVWNTSGLPDNQASFSGSTSSLHFPAAVKNAFGHRGVELVSVGVNPSADGYALVRRHAALTRSGDVELQDPVTLFSGRFRYFFRYKSRSGEESAAWSDALDVPASIRLTILDERGVVFRTPLEFPIYASMSSGCIAIRILPGCPRPPDQEGE
jgi:prepilin-type N-terminal cleavage/methylation domain-containing protein